MDGSATYKPNRFTKNSPHQVSTCYGAFSFKKGDIPNYITSDFAQWLKLWKVWNRKNCLPYSKSYMEHPWKITKVFEYFDNIYASKRG